MTGIPSPPGTHSRSLQPAGASSVTKGAERQQNKCTNLVRKLAQRWFITLPLDLRNGLATLQVKVQSSDMFLHGASKSLCVQPRSSTSALPFVPGVSIIRTSSRMSWHRIRAASHVSVEHQKEGSTSFALILLWPAPHDNST